MLARVLAMALCLSVCLPQVGVLSKWLDGLIWFLSWGLLSTSPTLCFKEIQVSTTIRVLTLKLLPKLRHIDHQKVLLI